MSSADCEKCIGLLGPNLGSLPIGLRQHFHSKHAGSPVNGLLPNQKTPEVVRAAAEFSAASPEVRSQFRPMIGVLMKVIVSVVYGRFIMCVSFKPLALYEAVCTRRARLYSYARDIPSLQMSLPR